MEILICHYRPDIVSGAERAIYEMVSQLAEKDHCTMMVPGEGVLADYYKKLDQKIWVKNISTPRRKYPGLHLLQSFFLINELKRRNISVVICNTFSAASRISTACKLSQIPYAIYIREYVANKPLYKKVLRKANRLITISLDLQKHIQTLVPERKVELVYDVILEKPILKIVQKKKQNIEHHSPFDQSSPLVGWVGRITKYKQPDVFIKAIPQVIAQHPNARFVLIGEASKSELYLEDELKRLAEDLNVSDKLVFLGLRNDVIELMCEMSVFCLTSTREPLGRVVLEAQLAEAPVIVPNTGGSAEIVDPYKNGLLFDSLSSESPTYLATKINELLADQKLRKMLTENAKKDVVSRFSSRDSVDKFEKILGDMAF